MRIPTLTSAFLLRSLCSDSSENFLKVHIGNEISKGPQQRGYFFVCNIPHGSVSVVMNVILFPDFKKYLAKLILKVTAMLVSLVFSL